MPAALRIWGLHDEGKGVCRKEHVLGNDITHPQIAADSKRMDLKLDRISKQPSFRRGDGASPAMSRGTPILAEAQSPAKPTAMRSLKSLVREFRV